MGDPDLISARFGVDQRAVAGNQLTGVNIWGSQVLIEIFFNTASDYQNDGLLDVTDQIRFYATSAPRRNGIKGLVCRIVSVVTTFSRGSFTHVVTATIVPEGELITDVSQQQAEDNARQSANTSENTRSDVRSPTYSSDEEADRAYEQSNYDIEDDVFGGLAGSSTTKVQAYANDDKDTNARQRNDQSIQNNSQQNARVDRFGILRPGGLLRRTNTRS
jgi:hypothetical protein